MKVYDAANIRNVALVGHTGSGKTQLASAILADTGMINRFGKVDDGTTVTDYDEEEIARKHTLSASLAFAEWNKQKINLIDTPGIGNFFSDVRAGLQVLGSGGGRGRRRGGRDGSDRKGLVRGRRARAAAHGRAEPDGSRAREPRAVSAVAAGVLSPDSDSDPAAASAKRRPSAAWWTWSPVRRSSSRPTRAASSKRCPIPADMTAAVDAARESLIEMVAEADEHLMEKFFEAGTLTDDELVAGLRTATIAAETVPARLHIRAHQCRRPAAARRHPGLPAIADRSSVRGARPSLVTRPRSRPTTKGRQRRLSGRRSRIRLPAASRCSASCPAR